MDTNFIKNLLYGDIEKLKNELKLLDKSDLLHIIAANYNWDNGFEVPEIIIDNKQCDFGTALMLFYRADGYRMLESINDFSNSQNKNWQSFVSKLYSRIEKNGFSLQNLSYTPELSKVQIFKLKKNNPNIPDVFLNKSPGIDIEMPVL